MGKYVAKRVKKHFNARQPEQIIKKRRYFYCSNSVTWIFHVPLKLTITLSKISMSKEIVPLSARIPFRPITEQAIPISFLLPAGENQNIRAKLKRIRDNQMGIFKAFSDC